jgi:hypothetical protein
MDEKACEVEPDEILQNIVFKTHSGGIQNSDGSFKAECRQQESEADYDRAIAVWYERHCWSFMSRCLVQTIQPQPLSTTILVVYFLRRVTTTEPLFVTKNHWRLLSRFSAMHDHPSTAITYTDIGSVLRAKGDYDGTLVQYEKGIARL